MPRKATVPCTVCGKPRIVGGKTKIGPCVSCYRKTLTRKVYGCTVCGKEVTRLAQTCQRCMGDRYREEGRHPVGPVRSSAKVKARARRIAWRSQHQSESLADRERRYPKSSWWAEAPREQWGAVVDTQRKERFQAGGCGVPATQKGLSEG
jgi:hypothetical protein